jgi:hypothetical protein
MIFRAIVTQFFFGLVCTGWTVALAQEAFQKPLVISVNTMRPTKLFGVKAGSQQWGQVLVNNINGGQSTGPNRAEYIVNIPASGKYDIRIKFAAADRRPVRVIVNTQVVNPNALSGTTGCWEFSCQQWSNVAQIDLAEGLANLILDSDSIFPHISEVQLSLLSKATHISTAQLPAINNQPNSPPSISEISPERRESRLGAPPEISVNTDVVSLPTNSASPLIGPQLATKLSLLNFRLGMTFEDVEKAVSETIGRAAYEKKTTQLTVFNSSLGRQVTLRNTPFENFIQALGNDGIGQAPKNQRLTFYFTSPISGRSLYAIIREVTYGESSPTNPDARKFVDSVLQKWGDTVTHRERSSSERTLRWFFQRNGEVLGESNYAGCSGQILNFVPEYSLTRLDLAKAQTKLACMSSAMLRWETGQGDTVTGFSMYVFNNDIYLNGLQRDFAYLAPLLDEKVRKIRDQNKQNQMSAPKL